MFFPTFTKIDSIWWVQNILFDANWSMDWRNVARRYFPGNGDCNLTPSYASVDLIFFDWLKKSEVWHKFHLPLVTSHILHGKSMAWAVRGGPVSLLLSVKTVTRGGYWQPTVLKECAARCARVHNRNEIIILWNKITNFSMEQSRKYFVCIFLGTSDVGITISSVLHFTDGFSEEKKNNYFKFKSKFSG